MSSLKRTTSNSDRTQRTIPEGPVHMIGAGGVGMAGLALLLRGIGHRVDGCDLSFGPYTEMLDKKGIKVEKAHSPSHIKDDIKWVIRSAAVPETEPEVKKALLAGLPVWKRGEALACLLEGRKSITIAGTHGKTTTTTYTAAILDIAGMRPSWCIGGESEHFPEPGGIGDPSLVVVEADESDGTLVHYRPDFAVLTNVDFDHMEHFENENAFKDCFRTYVRNVKKSLFFCVSDKVGSVIAKESPFAVPCGIDVLDGVGALNLEEVKDGFLFDLIYKREKLGVLHLPVRGAHNVLNLLCACGVAIELGINFDKLKRAVSRLKLPRRRFECVAANKGIKVISDYAHHPTEIKAVIQTALGLGHKRIIAIFQPHRYTRTLALGPDFPRAFSGVAKLSIMPVYAASEKPLEGGTSEDLLSHFDRSEESDLPDTVLLSDMEDAKSWLLSNWRDGDLVLIIGAGDIVSLAKWAASALEK